MRWLDTIKNAVDVGMMQIEEESSALCKDEDLKAVQVPHLSLSLEIPPLASTREMESASPLKHLETTETLLLK